MGTSKRGRPEKLKKGGPDWQVDVEWLDDRDDGVDLWITELDGAVRLKTKVYPHTDFAVVFRRAAVSPNPPCAPSKPRRVWCPRDASGVFHVAVASLGASIAYVDEATLAARRLLRAPAPSRTEPFTYRPNDWRPLLAALWAARPWDATPAGVVLQVDDPEQDLAPAVIELVGGDRPGYRIHASAAAYHAQLAAPNRVVVAFVPAESLGRDDATAAIAAGLSFDGRIASLTAEAAAGVTGVDEVEDDDAFTVLQALVGAWAQRGADALASGATTAVGTEVGAVTLRAVDAASL